MGKRRDNNKGRLQPFVPLLIETLDTPAWKAMSMGARVLYAALKRRYGVNIHNNGRRFTPPRPQIIRCRQHCAWPSSTTSIASTIARDM
jgi:hypothetical protein